MFLKSWMVGPDRRERGTQEVAYCLLVDFGLFASKAGKSLVGLAGMKIHLPELPEDGGPVVCLDFLDLHAVSIRG